MMFDERDALLRSICADPADDVPRLVFADWLQEHGDDDRAEFIRLQCRLPKLTRAAHRRKAQKRERVLLRDHEAEWREELPGRSGLAWGRFERGFVAEVRVTDDRLLWEPKPLWDGRVPVERFWLAPRSWEQRRRFGRRGEGQWARILGSAALRGVSRLILSGHELSDTEAALIARADTLGRVCELDLNANGIGDAGAEALAKSRHLKALGRLDLSGNPIRKHGRVALRRRFGYGVLL